MKGLDMFPEINPNIEEIVRQQEAIDPENVAVDITEKPKRTPHTEIFVNKGTKRVKKTKSRNTVMNEEKDEINSPTLTIIEEDLESPVKELNELSDETQLKKKGGTTSKRYSHIAKAREKGLQKRRANAAKRKELKELKKKEKEEERARRREATKERNRQKARARYQRLKKEKETQNPPKQELAPKIIKKKPTNMSYETFALYMNQYEKQKAVRQQKKKQVMKQQKPKKPEPPPYHPKNYPLAHLYNIPRNRTFF